MMRVALFLLAMSPAWAQEGPGWAVMSQQNQLGLLEYCQALGHVSAGVVQRQRRVLATSGSAQERAGQAGVIAYLTPQATLAEAAAASGTTVAYRCVLMSYQVTEEE